MRETKTETQTPAPRVLWMSERTGHIVCTEHGRFHTRVRPSQTSVNEGYDKWRKVTAADVLNWNNANTPTPLPPMSCDTCKAPPLTGPLPDPKATFVVGDVVQFVEGVGSKALQATVWVVTSEVSLKSSTYYIITPRNGGLPVRTRREDLVKVPGSGPAKVEDLPPVIVPGTVVTLRPGTLKGDPNVPLVVTATKGTMLTVTVLGENDTRYWSNIPSGRATVVPFDQIADHLRRFAS